MNFHKMIFPASALLGGLILLFYWNSEAFAPEDWQELPPLSFQDCIQVDKVLAPNPLSQGKNEFWMVLKYEEKNRNSLGLDAAGNPSEQTTRTLNMYLVTGVALLAEGDLGVSVYSFLIVNFTQETPTSKVTQQWLLSDTDNDGKLDKVRFEKIVKNASGQAIYLGEIEIPKDQIKPFQEYFEKASKELNSRAEEDASQQCLVS